MGQTIRLAATAPLAAIYGGLFGVVVYGVYDFTDCSTLRQWPFVPALAGLARSAGASAVWATVVRVAFR